MELLKKAVDYSRIGKTRQAINVCIESVRVVHAGLTKKIAEVKRELLKKLSADVGALSTRLLVLEKDVKALKETSGG